MDEKVSSNSLIFVLEKDRKKVSEKVREFGPENLFEKRIPKMFKNVFENVLQIRVPF